MKLNIKGNEAIVEDDDGFASKLMRGCKGKVKVTSPFGRHELKIVEKFKPVKSSAKSKKPKKK